MVGGTASNPRLHLLGRLAQREGLLEPAQLESCLAAQERTGERLGPVLVERGHVDQTQLQQLRERVLRLEDPPHRLSRREVLLARLVCERDLAPAEAVERAFREHALLEAEGVAEPFDETLVRLGMLTGFQRVLLKHLPRVVLLCDLCEQHYEVEGLPESHRMRCPDCRAPLRAPAGGDSQPAQPKQLVYDSVHAGEIALFVQAAVKHDFCSKEQLQDAAAYRARNCPLDDLGDVLLSRGVLDSEQLDAVRAVRASSLERREQMRRDRTRGCTFGRIGLLLGYYTHRVLDKVLSTRPADSSRSLSELMIEAEYLTPHQVSRIESYRSEPLYCCEPCKRHYDLPGTPRPTLPPCPQCKGRLTQTDLFDIALPVDQLSWQPGARERRADSGRRRLTKSAGPLTPTENGLIEVRRRFAEFYEDMPELQDPSESGRMRYPSVAFDISLLTNSQAMQKVNTSKGQRKLLGPPRRSEMRLLLGVVALVILLAGGWISVRRLLVPPPPAGDAAGGAADTQQTRPAPGRLPEAGERITLWGEVPWGKQWHIVREQIQGFCLRTPDGKIWWVVDTAGRSYLSLQALSNPQFETNPFLVKVSARVASGKIAELPPPDSARPVRQLICLRWERVHTAPAANGYLIVHGRPGSR